MQNIKIGIDCEEISRFPRLIEKKTFLLGVFTSSEQEYIFACKNSAQKAAGIFCAKEAVSKALEIGLFGLNPREIAINHKPSGKPTLSLTGKAAKRFPTAEFDVSISYTKQTATAVALCLM